MNKKIIWIIMVISILTGVGVYLMWNQRQSSLKMITNFEECAKAGYPILESYPGQCRTPDGKHFIEVIKTNY